MFKPIPRKIHSTITYIYHVDLLAKHKNDCIGRKIWNEVVPEKIKKLTNQKFNSGFKQFLLTKYESYFDVIIYIYPYQIVSFAACFHYFHGQCFFS